MRKCAWIANTLNYTLALSTLPARWKACWEKTLFSMGKFLDCSTLSMIGGWASLRGETLGIPQWQHTLNLQFVFFFWQQSCLLKNKNKKNLHLGNTRISLSRYFLLCTQISQGWIDNSTMSLSLFVFYEKWCFILFQNDKIHYTSWRHIEVSINKHNTWRIKATTHTYFM